MIRRWAMSRDDCTPEVKRVVFVGDYLPRKCGIATFTHDLHVAIADTFPAIKTQVVAVNDIAEGYNYNNAVRFEIDEQDPVSYSRAVDYINNCGASVVCVQHEYGIYGGPCGQMLIPFLRALKIPIVVTLHTILQEPSVEQRRILENIINISSRVVTMAEVGRNMLQNIYHADPAKVALIPHGIPEMEFADPEVYKVETGLTGSKVILTFGLLSPNKGIEYAIRAMAEVVKEVPDALYVILGQTHPALIREHGEAYRNSLEWLCKELNISANVKFINRFCDLPILKKYIASCDVYLTPYLHEQQITSGTLSYAFGMGTAVVSTPYWHAAELLAEGRGRLVPFREVEPMAKELIALLKDDAGRMALKRQAFEHGRSMTWSNTAKHYMRAFEDAVTDVATHEPVPVPSPTSLPAIKLDHLIRMSDSTGILQHATYSLPDFRHGYCVDDNARALMFCAELKHAHHPAFAQVEGHATCYAAYLNYSYSNATRRFRNFMSYGRQWLDENGTDDSNCRAMRCLGACIRAGLYEEWATSRFVEAVHGFKNCRSVRSMANLLLALNDFFRRYSGPNEYADIRVIRKDIAARLLKEFNTHKTETWVWPEHKLTYENAVLPHALIATGKEIGDEEMMSVGLDSLDWLMDHQMSAEGIFSPIGNESWFSMGGMKAEFDQQPIEAGTTVIACLAALEATGEPMWGSLAYAAFNWFVGGNALGKPIYNHQTGGCRDGLHADGVNMNEGAESLLVFLFSLLALQKAGVTVTGEQTAAV